MAANQGKKLKQVIDPTLAKAFTHPLRGHVWVTLCERGVASPKEIAGELGIDVSEVSYHFRELKRRKLVRLRRTVRRRGFAEHFYEPCNPLILFEDFEWMRIPPPVRSTFSGDMLRQIIEDLIDALHAGSFDARNRHLSRSWLSVDEQGWEESMQVMREALDRFQAIQKAAAKRREKASRPAIQMSVVMTAFEPAAGDGAGPASAP